MTILWRCRVIKLAGPLALQDCLIVLQGAVTVAFVGRLDARSLSAMVLTSSVYNITGLSIVMGAASGAETLSGQVGLLCRGMRNVTMTIRPASISSPVASQTFNSSLLCGAVLRSKELWCSGRRPAAEPLDYGSHWTLCVAAVDASPFRPHSDRQTSTLRAKCFFTSQQRGFIPSFCLPAHV